MKLIDVMPLIKDGWHLSRSGASGKRLAMMSLADVPAAEAVPVVHGRWLPQEMPTGIEAFGFKEMTVQAFMCSACGKSVDVSEGHYNYCPHCGARMDLEG